MAEARPPCERCRKKGLPCIVNRSLQMDDIAWREAIEQKIQHMEERFATFVNNTSVYSPASQRPDAAMMASDPVPADVSEYHHVSGTASNQATGMRIVIDLESNPATVPGLHLHHTAYMRPKPPVDMISRGVVTLVNARKYHALFQDRLDHFLYGILGDHSGATFEQLQQRSPILSTMVCAVGALHLASPDYEALYKEFITLSTGLSISKRNSMDDVQALCIGAFWMPDLSSSLVSFAVRIAIELQLYRSFSKALQGDRESYLCARLYYLVYACDHHLSIPHGRPPITRNCEAIENVRKFLDCKHTNEDDARLVSHVLRWRVCTGIFDALGTNADRPLSYDALPKVRRFSIELDSLRVEWGDRFRPDNHVGNYPSKGVGIQHHFAKLFLFSHAFRGLRSSQSQDNRSGNIELELHEMASSAVLSAISILRTVTSDSEIQSYLNGLPTYFHVMIAFAVVFLLKVTTRFSSFGEVDTHEVQRLMWRLIVVLKEVTAKMHPRHLLVTITKCTEEALQRTYTVPSSVTHGAALGSTQQLPDHEDELSSGIVFTEGMMNQFFNEYDFLTDSIPGPAL
ncbi:C6 transcription factor [Xylariaceae sp. FL0594]|nr:C6 transcription factor [Xylariaceae sp. FL0594]